MSRKTVFRRGLAPPFRWLVLATLSFAMERARAEEIRPFELEWVAPPGCPSAAEVRASVAQILRKEPAPSADPLRVYARVEEHPGGIWRCSVETRVGADVGRRTIEAESCTAAAESTALIVALILDPNAVTATDAPSPPPTATPIEPETENEAPPEPRSSSVTVFIGPGLGADVGTMPAPTYGVGAVGGMSLDATAIEIGFVVWKSQRGSVDGLAPEAGGSVGLVAGVAGVCPALPLARFDFGFCFAGELGRFNAEGYGLDQSTSAGSRWIAVGGGPLTRARLGETFSLSLRTELLFALDRPRFVVDIAGSTEEFHRPSPVVGRALLSLDVRFEP